VDSRSILLILPPLPDDTSLSSTPIEARLRLLLILSANSRIVSLDPSP
jgi:hypothetical protein